MGASLALKYALGTFEMIYDALCQHRRLYQGKLPIRIVLHPAVMRDLINECVNDEHKRNYIYNTERPDVYEFMGVPIYIEFNADRAKLVSPTNVVHYL